MSNFKFRKRAIKINPSYDNALSNLGLIYWEIGNLELAFSNLNLAIKYNPDHADFMQIIHSSEG